MSATLRVIQPPNSWSLLQQHQSINAFSKVIRIIFPSFVKCFAAGSFNPHPIDDRHVNSSHCTALFIDNSNLFIEGKKFFAKRLNLLVPQDPCFRIDIGKLCDVLLDGRNLSFGKLYGSEPPSLDTVWKKIREHGLNVSTYQRDSKHKEKELDNALTADATEYVCEMKAGGKTGTVLIVAGDRDYFPVVDKILKYGWKVEMSAFSVSINKKLKNLEESNKLFQIKTLENMFNIEPRWYYVNRRFKTQRPNLRRRIRMPRSRTMVLQFCEDFHDVEDLPKLMELADEVTKILHFPCLFKPITAKHSHKTRILFIVGISKTKSEIMTKEEKEQLISDNKYRKILRENGYPEEQIELIIRENRPKKGERVSASREIDFCNLWKRRKTVISETCEKLFGELQLSKTMVDYLQNVTEQDELEVANRFKLPVDGQDDDDDVEAMINSDETDYYPESSEDEDELDEHDDRSSVLSSKDFEEVTRNRCTSRVVTFSENCKYGFNCNNGLRCGRMHSDDEVKFFKMNEGNGARSYKSKPCDHFINRRACLKGKADIAPMCSWYHSIAEARCYQCKKHGGEIGHAATDCPMMSTLVGAVYRETCMLVWPQL
jgi:NYN domain